MKNRKVKIIAEVGLNHNGSLKLAKKIVKKLSRLDIDFIKFQFANPNLSMQPASHLRTLTSPI